MICPSCPNGNSEEDDRLPPTGRLLQRHGKLSCQFVERTLRLFIGQQKSNDHILAAESPPRRPSDDYFCGSGPRGPSIQTRYQSGMKVSQTELAESSPLATAAFAPDNRPRTGKRGCRTGFEPISFGL